MTYIIVYGYYKDFVVIEASGEKDLILQFAKYVGEKTDLLCMALKGCRTIDDMINMFNRFCQSGYEVVEILEINKTLYKSEKC